MSEAQDIINDAYRELNLIPISTTATTPQLNEGLTRLNNLQRMTFGGILGELMRDWEVPFQQRTAPVAANFPQSPYPLNQDALFMGLPLSGGSGTEFWPYPPKNSRLIAGITQNTTVYFPEQPSDGAFMAVLQGALGVNGVTLTLDGNSRTINGSPTQALLLPITAGQVWIYRADLADWRTVADLALTDTMPYVEDVNLFLTLALAIRLAPANDKTVSPETMLAYKDARALFQARYRQEGTTVYNSAEIPLSYESYLAGRYWW